MNFSSHLIIAGGRIDSGGAASRPTMWAIAIPIFAAMCTPVTEVYTTPGCRFCAQAKGFLKKRGVEYVEKDVGDDANLLNDMINRAGAATLPQIFIAGQHIGGCTDMLEMHKAGELASRFAAAGIELLDIPDEPAIVTSPIPEVCNRDGGVLNAPIFGSSSGTKDAKPGAADTLASAMQRTILQLVDEHTLDDGRCDMKALQISAEFATFLDLAGSLCSLSVTEQLGPSSSLSERKAFWINLYNCLVLHSTIVLGAPTDANERGRYFSGESGAAYDVGGLTFCLDDIEHGVLRANSPTVGGKTLFTADDPRLSCVLPELDPRLHFALNCGARSCPPIKVYTTARLEEGLDLASRAFLEADLSPDVEASKLVCTKLLDWYGPDFGADSRARIARLRDLLPVSEISSSPSIQTLRSDLDALATGPQSPTLVFRDYDWGSDIDP